MKSNNLFHSLSSKFIKLFFVSKTLFALSSVAIVSAVVIVYYSNFSQFKSTTLPIKKNTQEYKLVSVLVPHSGEKYTCYEDDKKTTAATIKSLSDAISIYNDEYSLNKGHTDFERQKVLERMNSLEKELNTYLSKACPYFKIISPSVTPSSQATTIDEIVEIAELTPSITQKAQERVLVVLPPNDQKYYCIKGTEDSIYKLRTFIDKSITNNKSVIDNAEKNIIQCKLNPYTDLANKCIEDVTKIRDDFKKSSDANVANIEMDFRKVLTEACL
jgi:hypothetical protein